jgi:nucleoside-diphosphate-sugar epimerase
VNSVLVLGRNSYLAGGLIAAAPRERLRLAHHGAIDDPGLLDGVGCVVSFAKDPAITSPDYRPDDDPDVRLARRLGDRGDIRFVMVSTRKVYAPSALPLAEDAPLGPTDAYGRNKLAVEERLRTLLGERRLTVLRVANVFGDERLPGRRTFMAQALGRLAREDRIVFDMSPLTPRDFLPVEAFGRIAAAVALDPPGGVLNAGSGIPLAAGRLAHWVLLGYGRGRLVAASGVERDGFVLDVRRLTARYGPPCSYDDLRRTCIGLGRRLATETAT